LLERAERKGAADRIQALEAELALPPFPLEIAYIWSAFWRLRRRTAGGFGGLEPITWDAIAAFSRYSGLRLEPWEVQIIEDVDDIYLRVNAVEPPKDGGAKGASD